MPKPKDLQNTKFGFLTAIKIVGQASDKSYVWQCICDCGNHIDVKSVSLISGNTKSCGCFYRKNLIGTRFNKLTVIDEAPRAKAGQSRWMCVCECGNQKIVMGSHLQSGNVKSCGCIRSESHVRHGMSYTVEWNSYHAAKKRCKPQYADKYPDHAGKGIEFRFGSFEEFYAEVGPRPEPKFAYSLDRWPNPYGNYEKGNIRWATKEQQALNRACEWCMARNNVLELSKRLATIPLTNPEL